jgi:CubicO group peptidase (beta-lactamase class C family)
MKFKLLTCTFLVALSYLTSAQNNNEITQKVDAYIESQAQDFHGTILLAVGDKVLMNKGYGVADYSNSIPNSPDTKYLIGSTTKHFTAVMILQMVEKNLIKLDDTIDKYFPNGPIDKTSKITIRHLLLHQSGIPQCYSGFPDYMDIHSKIYHNQKEFLQLIWDSKLQHEPGKRVTYTTPGYYLLGVILERASNKSYAELLKEYILHPLNMKNTFMDNNLTIHSKMATGYQRGVTGIVKSRINEQSNHFAGGDLISTTKDIFLFQRCLNYSSDSVLSSDYKKLLLKKQVGNTNFGAGFIGSKSTTYYNNKKDSIEMIGVGTSGSFGYRARMTRFINLDACYIVLSNIASDNKMDNALFSFLSDILLDEKNIDYTFSKNEPVRSHKKDLTQQPKNLKKYTGVYKGENSYISITQSNDTLIFQSAFFNWGSYSFNKRYLVSGREDALLEVNTNNEFYFTVDDNNVNLTSINKNDTLYTASKLVLGIKDYSEYSGIFYSLEHQKTYTFKIENGILISDNFLGNSHTEFTYLNKDMFSCKNGFIIFNRDKNMEIKNFRLNAEGIDTYEGVKVGLFEKK